MIDQFQNKVSTSYQVMVWQAYKKIKLNKGAAGIDELSWGPQIKKLLLPILFSLFGTKPPKKSIEAELCNDLPPGTTSKVVNEFTPEAKALYTTKITFELPDTKRVYIKLTNDKSMPTDLQDEMAKNLNATKVEAIHSGHLPMLSKPDQLANILSGFVESVKT